VELRRLSQIPYLCGTASQESAVSSKISTMWLGSFVGRVLVVRPASQELDLLDEFKVTRPDDIRPVR
jgi:hypothetical protein